MIALPWLAFALVACDGATGPTGAAGPAGTDGAAGAPGSSGADGSAGTAGTGGTMGQAGLNSLTRIDVEPAGAACAEGGLAVHTGLDDDRDGVLGASEIDATSYLCTPSGGQALVGDVGGIARLQGVQMHNGIDLLLEASSTAGGTSMSWSTTTDSTGAYLFEAVPAGLYRLMATAPGRFSKRVSQVVVLPGLFEVADLELLVSERLLETSDGVIAEVSPAGDFLLVHYGGLFPQGSTLIDVANERTATLAGLAQGKFDPLGRWAAFPSTSPDTVTVLDLSSRALTVSQGTLMGEPFVGDRFLLVMDCVATNDLGGGDFEYAINWKALDAETGGEVSLANTTYTGASCYASGTLLADGQTLISATGNQLELTANGTTSIDLSTSLTTYQISPDESVVVILEGISRSATLTEYNIATGNVRVLDSNVDAQSVQFSPDSAWLHYSRIDAYVALNRANPLPVILAPRIGAGGFRTQVPTFSPDSRHLAFVNEQGRVSSFNTMTRQISPIGPSQPLVARTIVRFAPNSQRLTYYLGTNIVVADLSAGTHSPIPATGSLGGTFDPSGQYIYYSVNAVRIPGVGSFGDLRIRDLSSGADTLLDTMAAPGPAAGGTLFYRVHAEDAPNDARDGIWRYAL